MSFSFRFLFFWWIRRHRLCFMWKYQMHVDGILFLLFWFCIGHRLCPNCEDSLWLKLDIMHILNIFSGWDSFRGSFFLSFSKDYFVVCLGTFKLNMTKSLKSSIIMIKSLNLKSAEDQITDIEIWITKKSDIFLKKIVFYAKTINQTWTSVQLIRFFCQQFSHAYASSITANSQ